MTSQRIPQDQAELLQSQINKAVQADPQGARQFAATHPQSGFPATDWLKTKGIQLPPDYQVGYDGILTYFDKNSGTFDKIFTASALVIGALTGGALLAPALAGGGPAAGAGGLAADGTLASTPITIGALTAPSIASGAGMSTATIPTTIGIDAATQTALPGHATIASSAAPGGSSAMQSFLKGMASPGGASLVNGGLGLVSGILNANANNKNEEANRQLTKDTTYLNSTQMNPVKQPIDIFRAAALRELANQGPTTLGGPHHDFSGVANQFLNDNNLSDSTNRFFGAQNQFAPPGTPPPPDYFKRRA